jgi:L-lactate dehydrogenase complex protein LldG
MLAQIASAVQAGNRYRRSRAEPIDPRAGYVGCKGDPADGLAHELRELQAEPVRICDPAAAKDALARILQQHEVRRVVMNPDPLLEELGIAGTLREAEQIELAVPQDLARLEREARRDWLFNSQLGVAVPDWAVAETGTLVYSVGPDRLRSTSLVPPVHLAVLHCSRIVPDLFDLFDCQPFSKPASMPDSVVLVSGPSKTADIELILTTGVHGPGKLYVFIYG